MIKNVNRNIVILLLIILASAVMAMGLVAHKTDKDMQSEILINARIVARSLDIELISSLSASKEDLNSPHYKHLKARLSRMRQAIVQCRFLYLMGQRLNGEVFFFIDSLPADSEDYAPPGLVYEEVSDSYLQVFNNKQEAVVWPISDRWGTLVTALIPLIDPPSGKLVAILGMDVDANNWTMNIIGHCIIPFVVMFLIAVLIISIAARKQTEKALGRSEEKYHNIFSSVTDTLLIFDYDGNIVEANPQACEMYGYSYEEIIGLSGKDIVHHDRFPVFEKFKKDVQETGEFYAESVDVRKDGSTFSIEIKGGTFLYKGRPHLLAVVRDISNRKKAEEALRESEEKLTRSKKMKALGLLAGGVAHDLNNILSGIVSYPQLLLLDLPEDSKLRKPIETILESGHRAAAIVQDLLTVARGVATSKEPLNLNDLIGYYLNSPEFKKLKKFHPAITVKTKLAMGLLNIYGSDVHIRKTLMNLVSNASEAIEGSGNVTISTVNRYVDRPIRGYDDVTIGEYVVLSVSDDGSGILSNDLERIFEPFYTKKVMGRSGTGLGLAVVWNTVQDHKGYIDVTTDKTGTTFELFFPITRDKILDKDLSIPLNDFKGNGETILVVDDVESQRDISCKMLDTLGYKTMSIPSGKEAVEYLKKHTVDLILLDMIMDPGINGRETYKRIIKTHPKQKAIIVSGFAETDEVKEAQKLGAGQYIKKPLTLEKIGLAVKNELKK